MNYLPEIPHATIIIYIFFQNMQYPVYCWSCTFSYMKLIYYPSYNKHNYPIQIYIYFAYFSVYKSNFVHFLKVTLHFLNYYWPVEQFYLQLLKETQHVLPTQYCIAFSEIRASFAHHIYIHLYYLLPLTVDNFSVTKVIFRSSRFGHFYWVQ